MIPLTVIGSPYSALAKQLRGPLRCHRYERDFDFAGEAAHFGRLGPTRLVPSHAEGVNRHVVLRGGVYTQKKGRGAVFDGEERETRT